MALGLLWLGLTLLGAVQTQASGTAHAARPLQTGLSKIHLQPNFKEDQFQGKWDPLGVAENRIRNGSESEFYMYSSTFELHGDHSYKVTTRMKNYPGVQIYTMRVAATNDNQYPMLFLKMQFKDTFYYEATVYGRTKELNADLKDRFVDFATFIGFKEENTHRAKDDSLSRPELLKKKTQAGKRHSEHKAASPAAALKPWPWFSFGWASPYPGPCRLLSDPDPEPNSEQDAPAARFLGRPEEAPASALPTVHLPVLVTISSYLQGPGELVVAATYTPSTPLQLLSPEGAAAVTQCKWPTEA
ncbi:Neutrophil gelatinase-associated lipocalin [Heterocephalus glaber]|uniref:Neutrophil gelatinase-associated lipocalin n=1 Tax=Heterocephalus glaber TaxID=10181 RepID=G5BLE9_HETGA|nr:Neutrophil gelatinase-associated lipocalin [Heterocephalus glaber]